MTKKKKKGGTMPPKKGATLPPMRPPAATIAEFPAPPAPGSRTPSKPPRSLPPRDPVDVVIEAVGELDLFDSAQIAARVCCDALALGLGARAVVIHAHDPRSRSMRVVAASGRGTEQLAGTTVGIADDVIASTVIDGGAMTLTIDPNVGLPRHAPERLRTIGATRAVVAMPTRVKQRVVALIEIVDARESAAHAIEPSAEYVSTQLGRFLENRKKG